MHFNKLAFKHYIKRCLQFYVLLLGAVFIEVPIIAQTVPTSFDISGNVFNDVNGLSDNVVNGIGIGNPAGNNLHVNLVSGGIVVKTTPVNNVGTFQFIAVDTGNYSMQISVLIGIPGLPQPATNLPNAWVYTGENLGASIGNDGNVNGILSNIHVINTNITNANFGIEALSTPISSVVPPHVNPGGPNAVPVAASNFSAIDPNGGYITAIRILNFPLGAAGISINGTYFNSANFPAGGVIIPTNNIGEPLQIIGLDPFNGNVTHHINYTSIDNAGMESVLMAQVQLSYYTISLSGNVFNDVNGLSDNIVNGIGIGNPSSTALYVNLINSFGYVIGSTPVLANGSYTFNSIDPGNYSLQVNSIQGIFAFIPPAIVLPLGWVITGEKFGSGNGNDGNANGILTGVLLIDSSMHHANFGIEELPTPISFTATPQVNLGGANFQTVNANSFGANDPSSGIITSIQIVSFPTNASHLTVNGISYTASGFPSVGITIPTNSYGEPLLPIMINPIDGDIIVSILFKAVDNAGKKSTITATVQLPFYTLSMFGTIYNDVNGLSDFIINGNPLGNPASNNLYANLINSSNQIVASTLVSSNGIFQFTSLYPSSYQIQLSTIQGIVAQAPPLTLLPSGWVYTGEFQGNGIGNDGNVDGLLSSIILLGSNISNLHFGIEELPNNLGLTSLPQVNPGSNIMIVMPASTFEASDPNGGFITSITLTSFPTNTNSISVNGNLYYAFNFPINGINIPSNASGQPLQSIEVDPLDGDSIINFSFIAYDNAGYANPIPGTASLPLFTLSISGNVINDANGLSDFMVNGIPVSNPTASLLYVNLLNAAGYVVQSSLLNATAGYQFNQLYPGNYILQLTIHQGVVGQAAPSSELPSGWTYTGEFQGIGIGNDGVVDGLLNQVTLGGNQVNNANFGVEELPVPYILSEFNQVNPGANIEVLVNPSLLGAYEFNGGYPTQITLNTFPTNSTTLIVDGISYTSLTFPLAGITIPLNSAGVPTLSVAVNPMAGAVTVVINFSASDNAGKTSPPNGMLSLPFFTIGISGNVFNDINGLSDNTVNGFGIGSIGSAPFYINLLDTLGIVLDTVLVQANGNYTFLEVDPGYYKLQLSSIVGNIGSAFPISQLPLNWVHTGEFVGTGIGNDGIPNNILSSVHVISSQINHANFGIEELPIPLNSSTVLGVNPGSNNCTIIPSTAFSADDASGGIITALTLISFPNNANSISVNGNLYTNLNFPLGGLQIPTLPNGELAQSFCIDPIDGSQTILIQYNAIDDANQVSVITAIAEFEFTTVTISGNVYYDLNGLVDGTINGTSISSPMGNIMYANLLDSTSTVIANTTISLLGNYTLQGVNGGNYSVQLSNMQGIVGQPAPASILPLNWTYTGENIGTALGNDGIADGKLVNIIISNTDIIDANFGIEELAIPIDANGSLQPNIGANIESLISATLFSASDASGGSVTGIHLPIFPEKANGIIINGIQYLPSNFPIAGITIPTNAIGQPLQTISVDPIDGAVAVILHYKAVDNANLKSTISAKVSMPFTMPYPDINVAFSNLLIHGNVSTNDKVPSGTTYANPLSNPSNPSAALPTVSSNGSYTFTTSIPGVYNFMVPVLSPGGGALLIELIINVLNNGLSTNPPVINLDVASTLSSMPVVINALANDGCGNLSCTVLPSTLSIITSPSNGIATVNPANGTIAYFPNPTFLGADTLVYQVCDNSIPTQCASAKQIIFVLPTNSLNTTSACDDYKMTHLNTAAYGNLLMNDIDPEHQTQTAALQNITIPGVGSFGVYSNGSYTFLPVNNFTGHVDLPYTVCDNGSPQACTQATLHILVSSNVAFPVIMRYFIANAKQCHANLYWGTESELNTSHFNILRKKIGDADFIKVAKVNAVGTTTEKQDYSFTDSNLADASYQYIIESEDIDGRLERSEINTLDISCNRNEHIVVYPNPAKDFINIKISSNLAEQYDIRLTDLSGRQMLHSNTISENGIKTIQLSTVNLSSGLYHLSIESENYRKVFLINLVR